jgi:predicted transposase YdaD
VPLPLKAGNPRPEGSEANTVEPTTPHNALFLSVFSCTENAAGALRAALRPELAARIDWGTLSLLDGHYVDEQLRESQSDLLFEVKLAGESIHLYVLFEHQSTVSGLMPLRLKRYIARIEDKWLAEHPGARRVPAVVPVVLSHAEGGWSGPTSMQELYGLPPDVLELVSPHLVSFSFVLDDLTIRTDDELRARAMQEIGRLALLVMRWVRSGPELMARLLEWSDLVRAVWEAPDGRRALGLVIRYMALATEPVTLQDLTTVLVPMLGEGAREVVMTEGQRLINEGRAQGEISGRAKGRAEGRAEGEVSGRAKGRAEALLALLAARSLSVSPEMRERIMSCTDLATLDKWLVRAVSAQSAAEALSEA